MLSTTDAPQDQGARQHAAPEEDADSDDEPIVIPAKSPEAIVDLTSEESSEEINQAELFRSENPVLQAALNSKKRITGKQYRPDIQPILQQTTTQTVTVFGMDPDSLAQLIAENKSSVTPKRFRDLNVQLKNKKPKKKTRGKKTKKKSKASPKKKAANKKDGKTKQPTTNSAEPLQGEAPKPTWKLCPAFIKREHSKCWKSALDAAINAGKSEQDAKDAASAAGRARTAELRQKFKDGLISHRGNDADDVA